MKKLLLSVLLAFVLVIPAYAVEGDDPATEPQPVTVGTLEELQEAIAAAEDGETIYVSAQITLQNLTLETTKNLTITRDEGYNGRIFVLYDGVVIDGFSFSDDREGEGGIIAVNDAENTGITIQNCTFEHGNTASMRFLIITGGVYSDNKILISHCNFDGATYGAISANRSTDITIDSCTFTNNEYSMTGGAVNSNGKLLIRDSNFTDNTANAGGAVYSSGDLTIENCQFSGNNIKASKYGKDIFSMDGTLTITDEQQDEAGFYDDVTGEKITLPLDSFSGIAKLAYLTTEQAAEYFAPPEPPQDDNDDPDEPGEDDGEDTPETPQEPGGQDGGTDTADDENPSQEPTEGGTGEDNQQEPQDQGKDDPADNPEDTENPKDQQGSGTEQDSKSDDPQDTPSEPAETTPEPSNDDNSNDNYTPPYRPSRPSTSVITVNPEPEPETEEQPQDDPAPIRQLVCGEARIDTSRTIILLGYGDGLSHESDPLTRAQMATIIYRLLDDDTIARYSEGDSTFADVAPEAWYAPFVQIIHSAGIVNGVEGGNYAPDGLVTWAQIVTVLSRFVEPQDYTLQYISYDGWAQSAVQTAVALGWIEDSIDFNPNAIISRGELVQLELYRA